MKKIIMAAFMATFVAGVCMTSCDEADTTSYMPTYVGLTIQPTALTAGDSVTFTAVQRKKGHLIYHADYNWTVTYATTDDEGHNDTIRTTKKASLVYDMENDDPVFKYLIPKGKGGRLQVKFHAEFRFSGIGVSDYEIIYDDTHSTVGEIFPRLSSSTDGYCDGTSRWLLVAPKE